MNKILRFILSIVVVVIFLQVFSFVGDLGYSTILIMNALSTPNIFVAIIYYLILAIAGYFLGYGCQSIIYKKLKIQNKYFFYVIVVLTLVSTFWVISMSKQADMQVEDMKAMEKSMRFIDLGGSRSHEIHTLKPNTLIVSFIYIASFLSSSIIKRRWQNVEYQET